MSESGSDDNFCKWGKICITWRYLHTFEITRAEFSYCRHQISTAIEVWNSWFNVKRCLEILHLATAFVSSEVTVEGGSKCRAF
ncbi:hypothetical protein TNCV_607381 [Trichonephila clavipes]|nr:hypothetical protein TNCV_607381 [Trichonephila clavipes]